MKLEEDFSGLSPNYMIITGEGRTELRLMRGLTYVYNGQDITLLFPLSSTPRRTQLKALDSIKIIPEKYRINSFIYIVDGDVFENSKVEKVKDYITSIGVEVENHILIQDAILFNCKHGNKLIELFCIISGPKTFIEEEIACLISIKFGIEIDLSGNRDYEWKKKIKSEVKKILRAKNLRLDSLIKQTGKKKLEVCFPNYCAVLKRIEENTRNKINPSITS